MLVDNAPSFTPQSIDEILTKVVRMAPSKNTAGDNWTVKELRILSYYLTKLRDDRDFYTFALDLLDKNWRNIFFNGLASVLLNSWHSIEPEYRELTSHLLTSKLEGYAESNRRFCLWKNLANLFDNNGPIRMAALLAAKNMSIEDAPSLLGFKKPSIRQEYYSDVILKYVTNNHITDYNTIERLFGLHDLDRTKKLLFAYLVETEDKNGDELRRSQLCHFANTHLGDISLVTSWSPFAGATEAEALRLKGAMELVNMWFTQQIVETFFETCVQDPNRKKFWLEYVQKRCVKDFKVAGSAAVKWLLLNNPKIGNMVLRHFIETNSSSSQTSALVLFIKNKMFVEFSDVGALYVYNQTHPVTKKIVKTRGKIISTSELKTPSMGVLVERNDLGDYYNCYEDGKLTHTGYWQDRLSAWMDKYFLPSKDNGVSFSDQKYDDIFKAKPLLAEHFKPQTVTHGNSNVVKQVEHSPENNNDGFVFVPEEPLFRYKIASKVLEHNVRVVANMQGFYLSLGENHYALIKHREAPVGNIWVMKAPLTGWKEIVHNYPGLINRSIGFIKITSKQVIFSSSLSAKDETIYKLY